jgi:hypothetical protein
MEDTDTNTPPTRVISKRILVELLGIRKESVMFYLWCMNPLAYFSLLFYIETCWLHTYIYIYMKTCLYTKPCFRNNVPLCMLYLMKLRII